MEDIIYKKSLKEVYVILNSSNQKIINKLPYDLKQYIINNMDDSYDFKVDLNKSLNEQKIMDKTKTTLARIYEKYLCNEVELIKLQEYKKAIEEEKRQKYNPDNLFKNKNI